MSIQLRDFVYNYKTKHKEGFTGSELEEVKSLFKNLAIDKFNNAMNGNTCMMIDGEIINYHCDVLTALSCGIENRDVKWYEFD